MAGNVKAKGIKQNKENGTFVLHGEQELMNELDVLLKSFVEQKRMKLNVKNYEPCWVVAE